MSFLKKILKYIKDLFAPKKCYLCKKEGFFLCQNCFDKIEKKYYFNEICYSCKNFSKNFETCKKCKNKVYYDKLIILTHYKIKVIKKLILDFKFFYKKEISLDFSKYLADKFIKYSKEELKKYKKTDFLVVPTSMYFFKKIIRSYNQTEILAKDFSKIFGFSYIDNLVLKIKNTKQQSTLSRQNRLSNLKNSFKIHKNLVDIIDNKIIILIDDVVSTGTTINEISKILKKYNPKKIIVLVIASGY